ncbi:protein phosphatase CheZ [Piscinibacter sp. Jin2]|uniref:Protein phosphatase CheZ n=2 Tax=Aquariibacter lacus TaxID=2801332 RepID=A0A9X0XED5_9BURK|nr:protein phosphatase CheZ [Piscinibacter lacus]
MLTPLQPQGASPEVYQKLGELTRMLHDALHQLGYAPRLRDVADNLPDAKSRLQYIAQKTADAANKVLNSVDQAKAEHEAIATQTRDMARRIVADPVKAVASGGVMNFVGEVEAASQRIDAHLTDIMMAQDFHDLTGQVVARVVGLASTIEDQLVELLKATAPAELAAVPPPAPRGETGSLQGPVVNTEGRTDIVHSQSEVDDLLASLGF